MRVIPAVLIVLVLGGCAASRGTGVGARARGGEAASTIADPQFLRDYAATRRFSLGRPRSVKVTPEGDAVLFLRSGPRSFVHNLYSFDTAAGEERELLTAEQVLQGAEEQLSPEEKAQRERMRMTARGIATYRPSKDGRRILVPLSGRLFVVDRDSGEVTELKSDAGYPIDPQLSPDGRYVGVVRDGELYVMDVASGKERRLTEGVGEFVTHGLAEFVAQEEMRRYHGFWWSPDSTHLAYQRTDTREVEPLFIMDAARPGEPPQSQPYPRAGKTNARVTLGVIPIAGGETRWVEWDRERYPYLTTVKWKKNAPLTILVQNREQTEEVLLAVDAASGKTTPLLVERDEAWLNLDQDMPHWLPDGSGFFWTTEREGWWQVELRDADGELIRPVTSTDFRFLGFVSYDPETRTAYILGSKHPTQRHLYRVAVGDDAERPARMTRQDGVHGAVFAKNHSVYVHSASLLTGEQFQIVKRRDGGAIGELRSVAEEPPFMPRIELTTVGTERQFHAVVVRPRQFDPARKYPVIMSVYGGPHAQMVTASARRYLLQQWIADHGFIVVAIDGRGTPARGRAWERAVKGDLITLALEDQVTALKALGRKYPSMDLRRVGIYGWSFGGYFAAHAVMQRPDVFHAAVAGAPVADWRDYDTHYTERYMGLPVENPEGYEAASALAYAKDLRRPLLIIHGTADDNVYFAHSLKLHDALFKAGRPHEMLVLRDFTHMVADPEVTYRLYERILIFLAEHLQEREIRT